MDNDDKILFTRTDQGRIVLDMPEPDWDRLLILLGHSTGLALAAGNKIIAHSGRQFVNRLNENNPAWTPIAEDDEIPQAGEDGPGYWKHETSGVLAPVVQAYLNGEKLNAFELRIMQNYVYQWVAHPTWKETNGRLQTLILKVAAIETQADLQQCIEAATLLGLDPL